MLEIVPLRVTGATKKLIFLPYAGGYAAIFNKYLHNINEHYDIYTIEYPGRNKTLERTQLTKSFQDLCWNISQLIQPVANFQTYLIGISMGGYIAFQVSQIFETILQFPLKHVYLLSVNNPSLLKSALVNPKNRYFDINGSQFVKYGQEFTNEIEKLMRLDRSILLTMQIDNFYLTKTPLTIFNGEKDQFCHDKQTENYWKNKTKCGFNYVTHTGGHIPSPIDMQHLIFT